MSSSAPRDPDGVLAGLDPEQRAAATAVSGPVVILAGAGTGKTRAITHRIAYAVLSGAHDPRRSLAVTFTARAAGELRHRLAGLGVEGVQARTFHAAALRQLRFFWPRVVGGAPPEILAQKAKVLGPVLSGTGRSERSLLRDVAAEIEWAKASQVTAADYPAAAAIARREAPDPLTFADVGNLYLAYDERKTAAGLIDFEDVLLLTVGMLDTRPDVAETVREQYRWFTVDEYQDVNPLQHRLLGLWLGERDELCVVGDASQTIYTFTGASSEHLLGFRRTYPHATEVRLVRSYRSSPQIVGLANQVLSAASGPTSRLGLQLRATRADGPAPTVTGHSDEVSEAAGVAARIGGLLAAGTPAREIAVLYRINAQSQVVEDALTAAGIAYVVRGESAFFGRAEVREAVTRLRGAARASSSGATGAGTSGGTEPEDGLGTQVRAVLSAMAWTADPPTGQGATRDRWENLLRVVTLADDLQAARPGATLSDMVADLDARSAVQAAPAAAGITLSTVHGAKGLEWDAVLVVGLSEGTFPISFADTPARQQEERRLFYVAITRARVHLALSWARTRAGGHGSRERSPFLDDLFGPAPDAPVPSGAVLRGTGSRGSRDRGRRSPATCSGCGVALTGGAESARGRCRSCPAAYDEEVLERLRSWRKQEAAVRSVPTFVVFSDATLEVVAERRPAQLRALVGIPGIGSVKLEQYGATLLALVADRPLPSGAAADVAPAAPATI